MTDFLDSKFAKKSDGLHALVCKDVKQNPNKRQKGQIAPDSSMKKYQKVYLKIPDEYAFALMDKYGKGLQYCVMQVIKENINIADLEV